MDNSSPLVDSRLVPLVGNLNAQDLWDLLGLVMPSWVLLAVLPRWKYTPMLTFISPVVHATLYTVSIVTLMVSSKEEEFADFRTLEGVVKMFRDPNSVFVGWVHYACFDLLVGRFIAIDAVERGVSNTMYAISIVPCLFFTFLLGPVGFLMYTVLRIVVLPQSQKR